ncbi:MAG: hypothetical protein ACE15E_24085 [Acidobacteriota bacterium]
MSREPVVFELASVKRDRFDSLRFTLTRVVKKNYWFSGSYTRSRSWSDSLLDFDLDTIVFGHAGGGPLAWDVPHRFLGWGWVAMRHKLELSSSIDWRSGFPYSVVNGYQQLVGRANGSRFNDYFAINVHVERRFRFANYECAFRVGVNNLTNHPNPGVINNNIDSPNFLQRRGIEDRSVVGRIRFLGKK